MTRSIYAVYDVVSAEIVGALLVFNHDAQAVRFFSDLARDQNTNVARHLADHELVKLGTLDTEAPQVVGRVGEAIVVISGKQLLDAQAATEGNN